MENVKTLGELLQDIVEKENKYFSLYDFLDEDNHLIRQDIKDKLEKAEQKQFFEYMDGYNFVNSDEVYMAVSEYTEKVMNRPLSMGEMWDMSEIADYYMSERWLEFDEEENRVENRKDFLFDDLNNILFEKHSEIIEYIEEWLDKHHLPKDDLIVWELASDFIDQKELYDLDYED